MVVPLVLTLLGATLLWASLPLWWRREEAVVSDGESALQELLFQKEALLTATRELDFDLQTDKLSPEDHRALRERCKLEAVEVLQRLERLAPPEQAAAPEPLQERVPAPVFCPACGREARPSHRFCTGCGQRLTEEAGSAV